MVQLIYVSIGSDKGLVSVRRRATIWYNEALVCWRMQASLNLNELILKHVTGYYGSIMLLVVW